jgi:ferredoxin
VTYVITSACIESRDRSCVEVCPVDCIYEAERMLVIHPGECIDCGACVPECPVEAIFPADDVPPEEEPFVAVNAAIEDGTGAVDAALRGQTTSI